MNNDICIQYNDYTYTDKKTEFEYY